MTTSRNAILSRLRDADPEIQTMESITYKPWTSTDSERLKQRFIDALTANHAEVITTNPSSLNETIKNIIVSKQFKRIAIGTSGEFYGEIVQANHQSETVLFDCDIKEWKSELFNDIDAGITHCRAGIADTGALVLWPNAAEPRTLSLVPPCHIALIKRSTIISNFPTLMVKQKWNNNMPTNIILISGPSKTADIQQTLAYGAHGPSKLVVILIEDT